VSFLSFPCMLSGLERDTPRERVELSEDGFDAPKENRHRHEAIKGDPATCCLQWQAAGMKPTR